MDPVAARNPVRPKHEEPWENQEYGRDVMRKQPALAVSCHIGCETPVEFCQHQPESPPTTLVNAPSNENRPNKSCLVKMPDSEVDVLLKCVNNQMPIFSGV